MTNGYNGKCRSRLKQSGLRDFSNFKAREDGDLKQGEQQGVDLRENLEKEQEYLVTGFNVSNELLSLVTSPCLT